MNPRTMLRKSVLIAPAEAALRRAETRAELEDAWFDYCDGFADGSAECRQLRAVYRDELDRVKRREQAAHYMRDIWGAG